MPVVQTPPPVPTPVSLASSALNATDEPGLRWQDGISYEPARCDGHGVIGACATRGLRRGGSPDCVTYRPFEIVAVDTHATIGGTGREWETNARQLLQAVTPFQLEREFWTGGLTRQASAEFPGDPWPNRYLAHPDAVVVGATAKDPAAALACLEGALSAGYGGRGMIHASRRVATLWQQEGLLRREQRLLLTAFDTIVVPGVGYPGTGEGIGVPGGLGSSTAAAGGTLTPGRYYYTVTALSASGETLESAFVEQVVPAGTNTNTVTVTWDAVTGATGYRLYGRTLTGAYGRIGETAALTLTDTGGAVGDGPPDSDTSGAATTGEEWAYATDMVTVRLSDPRVVTSGGPTLDHRRNLESFEVRRHAAATFDLCRHFGIRVNVPDCAA